MNEQRRVVYKYRREILEGRDMGDVAREQIAELIGAKVNEYTQSDVFEEWDLGGLETLCSSMWPLAEDLAELDARPRAASRSPRRSSTTRSAPTRSARRSSARS